MRSRIRSSLAGLLAVAVCLQPLQPLLAANNRLSRMVDAQVVNLTANVDWDYDAVAPTQAGTGGIPITKEVLQNQILRETARSVFLMTEGRHRVGTVFVFKNSRHGQDVDIRIINKSDRSFASAAKWLKPTGSSSNFLAMDGKAENLRNYARVIAHELGHYMYGFADEYRENGKAPNPNDPGGPSGSDFTRATIMNSHENFTRLSLAEDYQATDPAVNNTAQARVYATDRATLRGGSHWEMLARDPAADPADAKAFHEGDRTWFDAFRTAAPPSRLSDLKRYFGVLCRPDQENVACGEGDTSRDQTVPAAQRITDAGAYDKRLFEMSGGVGGADAADGQPGGAFESFKVSFVDSPGAAGVETQAAAARAGMKTRMAVTSQAATASSAVSRHVLVIDRSLPAKPFEEARQAAEAMLELAAPGSRWAVVVSPATGAAPLVAMSPVDTDRARLVAAVKSLTRADGRFDAAAAFAQAQAELDRGRSEVDPSSVLLLTAQGTTLPRELAASTRQASTAVNAIGLLLPAGSTASKVAGGITLDALATASGGHASGARNAEQAVKEALRAERKLAGEVFGLIATQAYDSLSPGTRSEEFTVTAHDKVVSAFWYFDPADKNRLGFRLVTRGGTYSTLSPASDLEDGFALIEVDNTTGEHSGTVRADTIAGAAVANPVELDVQAESEVELLVDVEGGTLADNRPPVVRAQLTAGTPVAKAVVRATVYDADTGLPVLADLALADDGRGVDSRADDGRYAVDLSGLLPPGDYTVVVRALTTADSVFQPNQVFAIGSTVPVRPVGAGLTRVDELTTTLEAGAVGVKSSGGGAGAAGGTSTGGGCTSIDGQHDAGLLLLLAAALLALWLRRGRRDGQPD